jgi:hypothetical protein
MPFLRTRYLLSASQFDKYQLPYNSGAAPPFNAAQLSYANMFQGVVASVVSGLPNAQQPGSFVYSSACFKHCTSDTGAFWGVRIQGVSLKEALAQWWLTDALEAAPARLVEACTGFGCGECHAPAPPLPPAPPAPPPAKPPRPPRFGVRRAAAPAVAAAPAGRSVRDAQSAAQRKKLMHHLLLALGGLACVIGCLLSAATRGANSAAARRRSRRRGSSEGVALTETDKLLPRRT